MLTIHPADPHQVAVALDVIIDWPAVAYIGIDDGALVGSGGLAWGGDRCWLWFTVLHPKPEYARPVLQMARKLLRKAKQLGEASVYTIRDQQYETSPRLLKLTGFKLHAVEQDQEVYRCDI
ncbi:hypothetical protein [Mesorhizobium sp. Root172]|uniref:hypothetical protein n=1 Tax=Mesorhizobium sp. Root172 TaxID=1736481 RepID=UPI0006F21729|nr:hypothetical protein [Mesorhizobium sp. Root172]KRB22675.1 hypothetical protein ASE05_15940 [Mesorhizobium sp. Root172]